MRTSEATNYVVPAFLDMQAMIAGVVKNQTNARTQSAYADLEAVVKAVKPALQANGLGFLQSSFEPAATAYVGITTRLIHSSGQWIESDLILPLGQLDPQGGQAAITYARRGGLASLTGLYQEDDDGESARRTTTQTPAAAPAADTPALLRPAQVKLLLGRIQRNKKDLGAILRTLGVTALADVEAGRYDECIELVGPTAKKAAQA